MTEHEKTIVAVSTPRGTGGIAVIRMSGNDAFRILANCWKGKDPLEFRTHTLHLGWIVDEEGKEIDQVVVSVFKAPNSYTGEDTVEISCHGSLWVQQAIFNRLSECGASGAGAGEFTRRAFANGKIDLAQADGIADMIAASSKATAKLAVAQMRGDFSRKLRDLRNKLVDIGSLLELELDFAEEDVEFADRSRLVSLAEEIRGLVNRLADSFKVGNAIKNGIEVVLVGVPNAGKSTLLNALIGDEKAIVSDIPGTTRDIIEDTAEISGILFRFFDTAGIHQSEDKIETIGIERAKKKILDASIILRIIDPTQALTDQSRELEEALSEAEGEVITVITKRDLLENAECKGQMTKTDRSIEISSFDEKDIDRLKNMLTELATREYNPDRELIITNARHYEALRNARPSLERLIEGLKNGVSADFLAQDLRETEHYLGMITGEVTSTEILHTIFSRYCIGK